MPAVLLGTELIILGLTWRCVMDYNIFMMAFGGIVFLFWLVNRLHKPSANEQ